MQKNCCFCGAEYDTENRGKLCFRKKDGSEIKIASAVFYNKHICICAKCLKPFAYGVLLTCQESLKLSQISIDDVKFEEE